MKKILFTGGGSAGHVLPNIALIEELLAEGKTELCYMGTDGIEKDIVATYKIPYYTISCPKLIRGKSLNAFKNNIQIPCAFHRAVKEAKKASSYSNPTSSFPRAVTWGSLLCLRGKS